MQHIAAISFTSGVNDWLARSRHPRILHVFDRACNLINERREVLSIVTAEIGDGPFNLVMHGLRDGDASQQNPEVFFNHLTVDSPVSVHEDQLRIGDFAISTANAKRWNPRPDWEMLHGKKDRIADQLTKLRITNYRESGGLDTPLGKLSGLLDHRGLPIASYQFFNSLVSSLSHALVRVDILTAKAIASELAGLGAGLTPAGDDYIMGAIYAAWIIHPADVTKPLVEEIANSAAPLTTSLSAAWLKSAGKGEAGILWHEFFDALISVGRTLAPHASAGVANPTYETAIQGSIAKILAVGETSGADGLAGFLGLFAAWMEEAGISNE